MSNHPLYQRYLNDVTVADVASDPAVVAARARVHALEVDHCQAFVSTEPLRKAIDDLPTHLASARAELSRLELQAASLATDVFVGAEPEHAWRDYEDDVARCRGLVHRLELAGPELEQRLRYKSGPVRRLGNDVTAASIELDKAIQTARHARADEKMRA